MDSLEPVIDQICLQPIPAKQTSPLAISVTNPLLLSDASNEELDEEVVDNNNEETKDNKRTKGYYDEQLAELNDGINNLQVTSPVEEEEEVINKKSYLSESTSSVEASSYMDDESTEHVVTPTLLTNSQTGKQNAYYSYARPSILRSDTDNDINSNTKPVPTSKQNVHPDFNARFQQIVELIHSFTHLAPMTQKMQANMDLMHLYQDFLHCAETYAKIIVSEGM